MKCFCCGFFFNHRNYTIEEVKKWGLNVKVKINVKCELLLKILDFINHHNMFVYYDNQNNSFTRKCNNFKKNMYHKMQKDIDYIYKKYNVNLEPDLLEEYDYFDVICFWFFVKKTPFSNWGRFCMNF